MDKNKKSSLTQRISFALNGISYAFFSQKNMRIHCIVSGLIIGMSWYLCISKTEWLWIFASIFLVLVSETMNTAIESAVDLVTDTYHPLAKHAKDCAAGAVLLSCLFSLIVAGFIFLPKWNH